MFGKKKKESTIKVNEAGEVTIEASVKDAAIAFALPQFLIEQGMTEVRVGSALLVTSAGSVQLVGFCDFVGVLAKVALDVKGARRSFVLNLVTGFQSRPVRRIGERRRLPFRPASAFTISSVAVSRRNEEGAKVSVRR